MTRVSEQIDSRDERLMRREIYCVSCGEEFRENRREWWRACEALWGTVRKSRLLSDKKLFQETIFNSSRYFQNQIKFFYSLLKRSDIFCKQFLARGLWSWLQFPAIH